MNKLLLSAMVLLTIFFFADSASALVWEIGGGTGGEKRDGELYDGTNYYYDFRPHIGIFISPHATVGAHVALDIVESGGGVLTQLEIGPRFSYYLDKAFIGYPFFDISLVYAPFFYKDTGQGDYRDTLFYLDTGIGYMYLLNQHIGVFVRAYYQQHRMDIEFVGIKNGYKYGGMVGVNIYFYTPI